MQDVSTLLHPVQVWIACAALAACSSSTAPLATPSLEGADRVELLAWQATLGSNYPLTLAGVDTVATVVRFFDAGSSEWRDTTLLPEHPIMAAVYSGQELRGSLGFAETAYGQGGLLIEQAAQRVRVRTASAADIARFLAFFDLSVKLEPYP